MHILGRLRLSGEGFQGHIVIGISICTANR